MAEGDRMGWRRVTPQDEIAEESEAPLTGVHDEFRTALRQEIDTARRNARSGAVPLVNGRQIAQVGSGYQYVFDVENALNVPGDAPGDLLISGQAPIEVVIVAINGLAVILSVGRDLGDFVPAARLQSNLTQLMRKLITRIENLANKPNPAGERIRGAAPVTGVPIRPEELGSLRSIQLNSGQRAAVCSAIGRDTTFVWGPPGTGKTATIGAIGAELLRRGRSVLIVSHTNTAVDQALLKIADEIGDEGGAIEAGAVLRVGDTVDPQFLNRPNLLLATHVALRSEELASRRADLVAEHRATVQQVLDLAKRIDLVEWLAEAGTAISELEEELAALLRQDSELAELRSALGSLREDEAHWNAARHAAAAALTAQQDLAEARSRAAEGWSHLDQARVAETRMEGALASAERTLSWAEELEPHRRRADELPSVEEQQQAVLKAHQALVSCANQQKEVYERIGSEQGKLRETLEVGAIARRWRGLPAPEDQQNLIAEERGRYDRIAQGREEAERSYELAQSRLPDVVALAEWLAPQADVPRPSAAREARDRARLEFRAAQSERGAAEQEVSVAKQVLANFEVSLAEFTETYEGEPALVSEQADAHARSLATCADEIERIARAVALRRRDLQDKVSVRLRALRESGLATAEFGPVEEMLSAVGDAYQRAKAETAGDDLGTLRAQRDDFNRRLVAIEAEMADIDEQLKKVEELVIGGARVIATTLTRAYLRDSIQARRFDTVVLDEASMAPIPAMWVAASLADAGVVAVGDYKQLPPIVMAKGEEAQTWLGRDIFAAADIRDHHTAPDHFVALTEQYRMNPAISAISNELIYDGLLTNGPSAGDETKLHGWYRTEWAHDTPVLRVDTGSTHAWVTSVTRGERSSRLNFLSATICVDLAEQLLAQDRAPLDVGEPARILIVSPYRPHAKLLELLLRESGLSGEVRAGTVHTFQGAEADVVVVDLVNDDPHWRVNLFTPDLDEQNKRLLNVALTRARCRLIVVGDFEYNAKLSKKAFLGRELLPLLEQYPAVDALQVVPEGLAGRAARSQRAVLAGEVEPGADRLVVTQQHFYPMLAGDLSRARSRAVIYSPFITENRIAQLEVQLQAAVERGVGVYVVTKALGDRGTRNASSYRGLEHALKAWGVAVVHKRNMHEKLVFIDNDVLWSGSLNPLSYSDTQEVMERRRSNQVVSDFAQTLRLEELVGEYSEGTPVCPFCGAEVVATEGAGEPYFWRCVEDDCFRRNIDAPRLAGGMVTCSNCASPVEFGEWGGVYKWRCKSNSRHRQNIARTHLRLPGMRALVPADILRQLDRKFGGNGQEKLPLSS